MKTEPGCCQSKTFGIPFVDTNNMKMRHSNKWKANIFHLQDIDHPGLGPQQIETTYLHSSFLNTNNTCECKNLVNLQTLSS